MVTHRVGREWREGCLSENPRNTEKQGQRSVAGLPSPGAHASCRENVRPKLWNCLQMLRKARGSCFITWPILEPGLSLGIGPERPEGITVAGPQLQCWSWLHGGRSVAVCRKRPQPEAGHESPLLWPQVQYLCNSLFFKGPSWAIKKISWGDFL